MLMDFITNGCYISTGVQLVLFVCLDPIKKADIKSYEISYSFDQIGHRRNAVGLYYLKGLVIYRVSF